MVFLAFHAPKPQIKRMIAKIALLALPWLIFSPLAGMALYVLGFSVDAMIVMSGPSLICLIVNVKTILRANTFQASVVSPPQDHQAHLRPQTANFDRQPD